MSSRFRNVENWIVFSTPFSVNISKSGDIGLIISKLIPSKYWIVYYPSHSPFIVDCTPTSSCSLLTYLNSTSWFFLWKFNSDECHFYLAISNFIPTLRQWTRLHAGTVVLFREFIKPWHPCRVKHSNIVSSSCGILFCRLFVYVDDLF